MALSITSNYAGQWAGKYIAAALLSGDTIAKGGIEVLPNIKYKETISKMAVSGIIANGSCDFTSAGNIALTEKVIQPEEFQVNNEFCLTPFVSSWEAAELGFSAYEQMPKKFSDFLIGEVAAQVAQKTEQSIWNGVNSNAGEFDGFVTLFSADSDVNDVTGTTVTASNVIAEMGKVIDACPSALYGKEDLNLYVSKNVAKAYVRALAAQGGGFENRVNMWYTMDQPLTFDGVNIFLAQGLNDNQMVLAQKSNLYFGTGLLSDHNLVKTLDMADLDGSQNVRVIMRFTSGIQYGYGSEVVLYKP
ncbi:MAG: hypothetical protein Unbinned306contig1002_41 [Prokaryotic dsDNA virus sp.]|nr:MAG: hypothetical protein Unbinned306contig1002_41 [Prokaryotic dsDNA virus sp.]|tara:strand:- start:3908 stop:4816 length:909 start_codon:yes stop_codon:yes gene_type:complete